MLFDPILRETATYPHKSFWLSILEVAYITIGYPAFCLALYLTDVHFQGELQHVGDVSEQKINC